MDKTHSAPRPTTPELYKTPATQITVSVRVSHHLPCGDTQCPYIVLTDPKLLIYRHTSVATVPSLMRSTIALLPYSNHCPSLGRSFFWCTAPLRMVTSGTDKLIPGRTVPPHSFSMWLKKHNPNSLNSCGMVEEVTCKTY